MATVTTRPATGRPNARRAERISGLGPVTSALMYLVLTTMALVAAYPFWWMLVAATRRSATILTIPPPILPGSDLMTNYQQLIAQMPFWRAMFNSIYVGVFSTALVLFFCSLGGYGFAKLTFPGRDMLFGLLLATLMIPSVLGIIP